MTSIIASSALDARMPQTQLPDIVSQSIFNISRLMEATLRPSLETDLLAIFSHYSCYPLAERD
jgi:hypothetical protein